MIQGRGALKGNPRGVIHQIPPISQYMKRSVSLVKRQLRFQTLTVFEVNREEAPSGMIARGHYNATSKFVDDDDVIHLKFEWAFTIAKDW